MQARGGLVQPQLIHFDLTIEEFDRGTVEVEDRFSGERRTISCAALVDCGFRLPTEPIAGADLRAGDCVAPRTIYEAVLEGRRAALAI